MVRSLRRRLRRRAAGDHRRRRIARRSLVTSLLEPADRRILGVRTASSATAAIVDPSFPTGNVLAARLFDAVRQLTPTVRQRRPNVLARHSSTGCLRAPGRTGHLRRSRPGRTTTARHHPDICSRRRIGQPARLGAALPQQHARRARRGVADRTDSTTRSRSVLRDTAFDCGMSN